MLFVTKINVIIICVKYFISAFIITIFASLITFFSEIKSDVKSILLTDLFLMKDY